MVKSRYIEAMLRRDQFQSPFKHFKNGISAKKMKKILFEEEGDKTETSRKRQIPYDKPGEIPAILRFPKVRHRQLAVKWAFGRFTPISSSLLEGKFGEVVHEHMHNITENLKEYNLSGEKM